jgi:hypothetical protein
MQPAELRLRVNYSALDGTILYKERLCQCKNEHLQSYLKGGRE